MSEDIPRREALSLFGSGAQSTGSRTLERLKMRGSIAIAVITFGFAGAGLALAGERSVLNACEDEWRAGRTAGTMSGWTWETFLPMCRNHHWEDLKTPDLDAQPAAASAPAAGAGKSTSECNAEYAANKAAIRASGQTKPAFVAACRAGK